MFASLTSRIILLGAVVACALAGLVALLLGAATETRDSFERVAKSQAVLVELNEAMSDLRDVESANRGFLLTHDPSFVALTDRRIADAHRHFLRLKELNSDDMHQHERAIVLHDIAGMRLVALQAITAMGRGGDFDGASRRVATGQGRILMTRIDRAAQQLVQTERDMLVDRARRAEARLTQIRYVLMIGGAGVALLVLLLVVAVVQGIRRPLRPILTALAAVGEGRVDVRLPNRTGSHEFDRLADGYNRMADRLDAADAAQRAGEAQLHAVNADLRAQRAALQARSAVTQLLGDMSHRLQAARSEAELAQVLDRFVPQVLPDVPGALYTHDNTCNLLTRVAWWGDPRGGAAFAPDDCWALRLGQGHRYRDDGCEIACHHVGAAEEGGAYHCEPLMAGGELIGMLFVDGAVGEADTFRVTALGENISSALVNHRLQRDLKEQTVRDALTGLHNRRYMEEALGAELARADGDAAALAVVLCDVDHFKRFNDDYGHDAGDAVLQMVAATLRAHSRDGEVACRYGGEEFAMIVPGAAIELLLPRIERLRAAIAGLRVAHGGRALGPVSMSFGIAVWHPSMGPDRAPLVAAADAALYRAKRDGRNRAVLAERLAA